MTDPSLITLGRAPDLKQQGIGTMALKIRTHAPVLPLVVVIEAMLYAKENAGVLFWSSMWLAFIVFSSNLLTHIMGARRDG